jgi:hypothetical protein
VRIVGLLWEATTATSVTFCFTVVRFCTGVCRALPTCLPRTVGD